jgi:hypothetical protein
MATLARSISRPARPEALLRPEVLALASAIAGAGLRLQAAWSSVPNLLLKSTSDDAFYYFKIAENISSGHNVTFDGENLTNGFHPLWLVVLTFLSFFTDDKVLLLHLGLTVAAILGAATSLLIFAIVSRLTHNGRAALVGATFYAIHPFIVADAVNGLETSLAVFMIALTTLLFVRAATSEAPLRWRDHVPLGVAGGLMVLSRTDLALLLPPMALYLIVRDWRQGPWQNAAAFAGAAGLVILPWLIWMLVTFGTVIQVSGVAIPDIQRQAFLDANGDSLSTQLRQSWDVTDQALLHQVPDFYFVPGASLRVPFLAGVGLAITFMLLAPLRPQCDRARRDLLIVAMPAAGILAGLLFHTAIQWHTREWYYAPVPLIGALLLGYGVHYVADLLRGTAVAWDTFDREAVDAARAQPLDYATHRGLGVLAVFAAAAAIVFGVYGPQQSHTYLLRLPHRLNMYETAQWLSENTEDDARIASFNAGILGYFSDRTVINIDGVVNEDAYHARRDGTLVAYVCEDARAEYVVDLELAGTWEGATCPSDPCLSFELVATIGQRLFYFGGAQLDVLRLTDARDTGCAATRPAAPAGRRFRL